jgi:hypothetical protein
VQGFTGWRRSFELLCSEQSIYPLYIWKGSFERLIFVQGIGVLNARLLGFKPKCEVDEMKKILDKPYEKDEFFKKWLVGLSPRTKENYSNEFHDWYIFIGMTPTARAR